MVKWVFGIDVKIIFNFLLEFNVMCDRTNRIGSEKNEKSEKSLVLAGGKTIL